jgi:MFS family permease
MFLGADMTLFMAALGLIGPTTLVPLFVSKLTDNPLAIGALTTALQLGWLSQVFAAGYLEQSARKRPWLLVFGGLERLPALGLTVSALALQSVGAAGVLALIYLCRFGQTLAGGPAAATWLDYVARTVPAQRRGRFLGISTMLGNLLGVAGAGLAALLLDRLSFPLGFAACFGLAFLMLVGGYLPLFWVVEPPGPPPRSPRPLREQLSELPSVLAADPPFRRFLTSLAATLLGTMGSTFLVVYAATQLGASDELAAWYTAALLVGQVAANLLLGWLADRLGFSAVGRASALAGAGLAVICLLASSPLWLAASFLLLGVNLAGVMMAQLAGPMEFAPSARRPTYIALATCLLGVVAAAAPLIGGQVVATLGYQSLFGVSIVFSLLAVAAFGPQTRSIGRASPELPLT